MILYSCPPPPPPPPPAQPPYRISTFWGQKTLGYLIEICQSHVDLIARVWQNFKFWTANPQTAPSQTIVCKNYETFHIFGHFKVRRPPPAPMTNVRKSGLNFLFSVIPTTLNWG
jgi:hypothetical protein